MLRLLRLERRCFPDCVALYNENARWAIEDKGQKGRTDERVRAKRRAAESVARRLMGADGFSGDSGRLIACEDDVVASDSWDELKAKSSPMGNAWREVRKAIQGAPIEQSNL